MKIEIEGMKKLERALLKDAAKRMEHPRAIRGHSVIVGYTASYALHVHENIEMKWWGVQRDPRKRPVGSLGGPKKYHQKKPRSRKINPKGKFWDPLKRGSSKYLEGPARLLHNSGTIKQIVVTAMKRGAKLQHAIYLAALRIQRESQKMVPVDTGNLKASAFTKKE